METIQGVTEIWTKPNIEEEQETPETEMRERKWKEEEEKYIKIANEGVTGSELTTADIEDKLIQQYL